MKVSILSEDEDQFEFFLCEVEETVLKLQEEGANAEQTFEVMVDVFYKKVKKDNTKKELCELIILMATRILADELRSSRDSKLAEN